MLGSVPFLEKSYELPYIQVITICNQLPCCPASSLPSWA